MNKMFIEQNSGLVGINELIIGPHTSFSDFESNFAGEVRLIFGCGGSGKYGLTAPVKIFGEEYRLYFNFDSGVLQRCSIELISGVAREIVADYPEYSELQKEVEYLENIYKKIFTGDFFSEFEWKKQWRYNWGVIALTQVAHNAKVVTDFLWTK